LTQANPMEQSALVLEKKLASLLGTTSKMLGSNVFLARGLIWNQTYTETAEG